MRIVKISFYFRLSSTVLRPLCNVLHEFRYLDIRTKGQLISKQNCLAVTFHKKQTSEFVFLSWRPGNAWNLNRNSSFMYFQVVMFFGRSYGSTILFRDLLTFETWLDLCILFFVPKIPGNTEQQHVVRTVLSMIDVAIFQIIIQREGRKKAEKK